MAEFNLARIRFRWQGEWEGSTVYRKDDIVYYGARVYVALSAHTSDALIATDFSANRWELHSDGIDWKGNWTNSTFYKIDDVVKDNGIVYRAITEHTSDTTLNNDIGKWIIIAPTSNWTNNWVQSTLYRVNDVVKYNGIVYIANTEHTSSILADGLENDQSKWDIVTRSDSWKNNWQINTDYKVNDIARYGANLHRCVTRHTSAGTTTFGLETDDANWEIVFRGIRYRSTWAGSTRYIINDIVKYSDSLYICTGGNEDVTFEYGNWNIWLPGLGFEDIWFSDTEYQIGDIVSYGGYTYISLQVNTGEEPGTDLLTQDLGFWEVITTAYEYSGEYVSTNSYRVGDLTTRGGYLYVALRDQEGNLNEQPGESPIYWELLSTSQNHRKEWSRYNEDDSSSNVYFLGDVVLDESTAFICIKQHSVNEFESRPKYDTDPLTGANQYWTILVKGNEDATLNEVGDLLSYGFDEDSTSSIGNKPLPIGTVGQALSPLDSSEIDWKNFEIVNKIYYVAPGGVDSEQNGKAISSAFRTVKYACDYILADEAARAPATIFIKTGTYEEILPISIPQDVALVGDELRSTVIKPAAGYQESNMFYVRNGSGILNMSLRGLSGTLGEPNENLTRRPSAGAFVSLDPGTGPDDADVQILFKSPYIQNVSTFGTGCVGLKVDGSLHNDGYRSVVANDFTQILSDGIGFWADNLGRSELVSVFTYYCHIGYLTTNGGFVRATNGNNSYGTYGSVSEGFNGLEEPITANFNNRTKEAQIERMYLSKTLEILSVGFTHAGQDYTDATIGITGSGIGVDAVFDEFRSGGISEIRVTEEDSNRIGGANYTNFINGAQGGSGTTLILSSADDNTADRLEGQRVLLISGTGIGQYGWIQNYDPLTNIAIIYRESDNEPGWDHISNGWNIESALDETSRYQILPRVSIEAPASSANNRTLPSSGNWKDVTISNGSAIAVGESDLSAYTTDGITWSSSTIPAGDYNSLDGDGTDNLLAVGNSGIGAISDDNGLTWSAASPADYFLSDRLIATASVSSHDIQSSTFSVLTGTEYTFSVYAKPNGYNWIRLAIGNQGFPSTQIAFFNIVTGAVGTTALEPSSSTSVEDVGNGWYRLSITATSDATVSTQVVSINVCQSDNQTSFLGDGTSGIFVRGAIFEASNSVSPYPLSFNLFDYSENFETSKWIAGVSLANFFSISSNELLAPDNTLTGTKFEATPVTANGLFLRSITLLPANDYFISIYVYVPSQSGINNWAIVCDAQDTSDYAIGETKTIFNKWIRYEIPLTYTGTRTFLDFNFRFNSGAPSVGQYFYVWGAQIEKSSTLGLYQKTEGSISSVLTENQAVDFTTGWTETGLTITSDQENFSDGVINIQSIAYGSDRYIAVGDGNTSLLTQDGTTYSFRDLPVSSSPGVWKSIAYGKGIFVAIAQDSDEAAYSTDFGATWTSSTLPETTSWESITYGKGTFAAVSSGSNTVAYSDDGITWNSGKLTVPPITYSGVSSTSQSPSLGSFATFDVIKQNNRYIVTLVDGGDDYADDDIVIIAGSNVGGTTPANDITLTVTGVSDSSAGPITDFTYTGTPLEIVAEWSSISYDKNGAFYATANQYNATDTVLACKSWDARSWITEVLSTNTSTRAVAGGRLNGTNQFVTVSDSSSNISHTVFVGAKAFATTYPGSGQIGEFELHDVGGGYTTEPTITIVDNTSTSDVTFDVRLNNGVLAQPVFKNRGSSYTNATGTITSGDGFADIYQTGTLVFLKNLSRLPNPGDSFQISGINDRSYFIVRVESSSGSQPTIDASISISPGIGLQESPINNEDVTIRQEYSQIRLTGHDFLDIGTGNLINTDYPDLYIFGETTLNERQQFNEVIEYNTGRVFYTSTDQDGNFRVGELFQVEQSTGIITISADFFDLSGLNEIRLGGVVVGGSSTVIREFSTDPTFGADSNNIVPTQKAIAAYLLSRISGGGSTVRVSRLNAGAISAYEDEIVSSGNNIIFNVDNTNIQSMKGDITARYYFLRKNGRNF